MLLGATTQFTATGHSSDTTTANITSTVNWTSSMPTAATVNNIGATRDVDVTVNPGPATEADELFLLQLVSSSVNGRIADILASGNISAGG